MQNLQQVDNCHVTYKPGLIEQNEYLLGKQVRALCHRTGEEIYRGKATGLELKTPREATIGMAGYCGVFVEIQASNSDRSEIHRCRVEFVEVIGSSG